MVWMVLIQERFLVEACSPLITAICTAIHKMHVHQYVKQIPIHTVVFVTTQYNKVRILHYIL
jgi:hypothetical protein